MSDKPKQWGPHASPEGLGKLRTAVATFPDQKYVSVSGPGFRAKKAGDYQEVVTFDVAPSQNKFEAHHGVFAAQVVPWDSDYEKMADPNGYTGQDGWFIWKDKTLKREPRSVKKEKAYSIGMHNWFSSKKNSPIITFPAATTLRWKDKDSVKRKDWGNVHLDGDLILSFGGKFTRRGKVYDHSELMDWCCLTAWYQGSGVKTRAYVAMCSFENPSHVRILRQVKGNGDVCMGWSLYAENENLIPTGRTLAAGGINLNSAGEPYTTIIRSPAIAFPARANESGTAFAAIQANNDGKLSAGALCEIKIEFNDSGQAGLVINEVVDLRGAAKTSYAVCGFGYPLGSDKLRYLILEKRNDGGQVWLPHDTSSPSGKWQDSYSSTITESGNFVISSYHYRDISHIDAEYESHSLPGFDLPTHIDFRLGKALVRFYPPMSEWWWNVHWGFKLTDYVHPSASVPHQPIEKGGVLAEENFFLSGNFGDVFDVMQIHPDGKMCVAYMLTTSYNYASYTFFTQKETEYMVPLQVEGGARALRSCVFFRRKSNSTFRSSF